MVRTQSVSVGVGETWSTFTSEKITGRAVGGVIDLITKGNASKSKSIPPTSMPTASLLPVRPVSASLRAGTSTNSVPGVNTDTIGPTPIARSPSKLAHIVLPQSALESEEEEGSEGDELPTFRCGSAKSRTKKRVAIARPAPRPFPMQLVSQSTASPCASRFREKDRARHDDEYDDDDVVEIVDVFTTPRRPSPPRSPTPSPSPVKPPSVLASGPATFVKPRQSSGFTTSPTKSKSQTDNEPHQKTKQHRHASSDRDTHVSGNERDGILKSPRKSAAHSSPRHVPRARGRAPSPTPLASSGSTSRANNAALSDGRRPEPEDSGSMQIGDGVGRKPRPSDASAIYISSGSEDEGNAGLGVDSSRGGGQAEVNGDQDECTDREADAWADTGMILSSPPSPARAPPPANDDPVPPFPAAEVVLPNPARASKFKPTLAAASKVDVRTPASDTTISTSFKGTTSGEDTVAPRPVRRAPLLVARAKRSKGRDDDVIDLTSD
jgi:hypothetical protein